jgi:hypothetical protein
VSIGVGGFSGHHPQRNNRSTLRLSVCLASRSCEKSTDVRLLYARTRSSAIWSDRSAARRSAIVASNLGRNSCINKARLPPNIKVFDQSEPAPLGREISAAPMTNECPGTSTNSRAFCGFKIGVTFSGIPKIPFDSAR